MTGRHDFTLDGPDRIVFARGSEARVAQELESLGAKRVLLVHQPGHGVPALPVNDRQGGKPGRGIDPVLDGRDPVAGDQDVFLSQRFRREKRYVSNQCDHGWSDQKKIFPGFISPLGSIRSLMARMRA